MCGNDSTGGRRYFSMATAKTGNIRPAAGQCSCDFNIGGNTTGGNTREEYRRFADVFAIQSEIAKTIADQLQAKLSPKEKAAIEQAPTTDLGAFDLYSRAKTLLLNTSFSALASQNYVNAIELLNQALARDPS